MNETIEPIKLYRISEARYVRLKKIEGDPTKAMQQVYTLLLELPATCVCLSELEKRWCTHPKRFWGDAGQVWDCSRYHNPSYEPVFTSPGTDDEPQFYRSMDDLVAAFKAAGVQHVYIDTELYA